MGYGLGIALIAIGLILAYAVDDVVPGVNMTLIGWILAGAGILVIIVTMIQLNSRRRSTVTTTHTADGSHTVSSSDPPPPAI